MTEITGQGLLQVIQTYDLSIRQVVENMQVLENHNLSDELKRAILFNKSTTAGFFGAILVLDRNGNLRISSRDLQVGPQNFADREYFTAQRDSEVPDLYISKPFLSRLSNLYTIALSRPLRTADGKFDGVVLGTIKLDSFRNLLSKIDQGANDSAAIFRADGTLIARQPFDEAQIGRDMHDWVLCRRDLSGHRGNFEATSDIDGALRLYSYAQIGNYPLFVSLGIAKIEALQDWQYRSIVMAAIVLLLLTAGALLGILLLSELRKRRRTETLLKATAAELERWARTDKLTSLANRRHFDEVIEEEWRRHYRSQTQISLLMIDVDYFKAFNDTLGHGAGDETLAKVAECINSAVQRPSDLAARFGGEEFAVVLPDTPLSGAIEVAARIRANLSEKNLHHPKGIDRVVTVSIGIATVNPHLIGLDWLDFVNSADIALYRAKGQGRNCVVCAKDSEEENKRAMMKLVAS